MGKRCMPDTQIEESCELNNYIKDQIKASENFRFIHRLHCVMMVEQGKSISEVANLFEDDVSSVARWVRHFNIFGIQGLHDDNKSGRPAKLTIDQLRELKYKLGKPPHSFGYEKQQWDGRLLMQYLKQEYDISLGMRQCQRLLKNLKSDDIAPVF